MVSAKRWFTVAVLMTAALALAPSAGQAQQARFVPITPSRQPLAQPPNVGTPLIGLQVRPQIREVHVVVPMGQQCVT